MFPDLEGNNEAPDKMDSIFQEKLHGFQMAPPADGWQKINRSLNRKRRRFGMLLISALMLFTGTVTFLALKWPQENDASLSMAEFRPPFTHHNKPIIGAEKVNSGIVMPNPPTNPVKKQDTDKASGKSNELPRSSEANMGTILSTNTRNIKEKPIVKSGGNQEKSPNREHKYLGLISVAKKAKQRKAEAPTKFGTILQTGSAMVMANTREGKGTKSKPNKDLATALNANMTELNNDNSIKGYLKGAEKLDFTQQNNPDTVNNTIGQKSAALTDSNQFVSNKIPPKPLNLRPDSVQKLGEPQTLKRHWLMDVFVLPRYQFLRQIPNPNDQILVQNIAPVSGFKITRLGFEAGIRIIRPLGRYSEWNAGLNIASLSETINYQVQSNKIAYFEYVSSASNNSEVIKPIFAANSYETRISNLYSGFQVGLGTFFGPRNCFRLGFSGSLNLLITGNTKTFTNGILTESKQQTGFNNLINGNAGLSVGYVVPLKNGKTILVEPTFNYFMLPTTNPNAPIGTKPYTLGISVNYRLKLK